MRSASLPSGTAKKNDTTPATVRPRPTWAALRPTIWVKKTALPVRNVPSPIAKSTDWTDSFRASGVGGSIRESREAIPCILSPAVAFVAWFCSVRVAGPTRWSTSCVVARRARRRAAVRRDVRLDREAKRVVLSRRAVLASVAATERRLGASGRWVLTLPPSYVAGVQVIVRSLVAGHEPMAEWPDDERLVRLARADPAAPDARRPADLAALQRAHTVLLGRRSDRPALARAGRGGRRPRRGDLRLGRDGRRLCLRRDAARRRGRRDRRRRADPDRRAHALRRLRGRPRADRADPGGRLVPHRRRRPDRRRRPAQVSAGSTTSWSAAASTCPARPSPPGCASTPTWGGRGGRRTRRGVGQPAGGVRRRHAPRRLATGWPRYTPGRGRRASSSRSTRSRCCPTASPTASPCGSWQQAVSHEGLLDPDAHPVPRHHRARGRAAARRGRAGGSGARSSSTTPRPPRPGSPAPRGRGRWLARAAAGRSGQRDGAGGRTRAGARDRASGGCRTAKVKVAEPGQSLADDQARVEAVRDALGPAGPVRVDANGGWSVDEAVRAIGGSTGPPAAWSTSSSPRPSRTSPSSAAGSTWRSPPTSRSGGRRTPTACATSRPPTSPCSRCSRSAGCARACGSPRTSACRSWCRQRSSPGWASPPGSPWRRPARAALRLRARDGAAAHRRPVAEPLLPVDGVLPVGGRGRRRPRRLAGRGRPGRPLGARLRVGRQDRRS